MTAADAKIGIHPARTDRKVARTMMTLSFFGSVGHGVQFKRTLRIAENTVNHGESSEPREVGNVSSLAEKLR